MKKETRVRNQKRKLSTRGREPKKENKNVDKESPEETQKEDFYEPI